jgi:hypothetical protein
MCDRRVSLAFFLIGEISISWLRRPGVGIMIRGGFHAGCVFGLS